MENTVRSTPKDVFLHLFNIFTFYLSVIGFITLYIQYINALFPDALNYYYNSIAGSVRWASSILFVSVPAYIFTAWLLGRDINEVPEKRDLKLRKWLLYFTLFLSAITIIIDLMIFVYNFLNGELTIRFFLKVLVVLMVAGAVFGYYMWDLKRGNAKTNMPRNLAISVSVLVLVSIVLGFFVVGTPMDQRRRRMDDQRISDLQMIQGQVIDYWVRKGALPAKLENLQDNISGFIVPTDPESKVQYEYIVDTNLKFELCAVFAMANNDKDSTSFKTRAMIYSPYDSFQQNWQHDKGRTCFSRTIDPELYKNNVNGKPIPLETVK
jgi:hypothetical protein